MAEINIGIDKNNKIGSGTNKIVYAVKSNTNKAETLFTTDLPLDNLSDNLVIKRTQTECINLYKGYEHLINHVLHHYDKLIDDIKNNIEKNVILLKA